MYFPHLGKAKHDTVTVDWQVYYTLWRDTGLENQIPTNCSDVYTKTGFYKSFYLHLDKAIRNVCLHVFDWPAQRLVR